MSRPCVVLVPIGGTIDPRCELALHGLEQRGYTVRRVLGFSAIDFGRCVLASEALANGFQELMWVDSDVAFHPDDVEKLRAHNLPLACGIYPKKSRQEFACDFLPGTNKVEFGKDGGLHEIRYAGFGFVHTRRILYDTIRETLQMPWCNQRFGKPVSPYFMPTIVPDEKGTWYLSEDYAFCERARMCGFRIMADTTIKLQHVGSYAYSWDDVRSPREKLGNLTVNMQWGKKGTPGSTEVASPDATDARQQAVEIDRRAQTEVADQP